MKYFNFLPESDRFFFQEPCPFSKTTARDLLRKAVGGLLYIPGANQTIAQTVIAGKVRGLVSMALCLEDAVGDGTRTACEENVRRQIQILAMALEDGTLPPDHLPLLFVRVENNDMLERMADFFVRYSHILTGVILPKTLRSDLNRSLTLCDEIARGAAEPFYAMPILESDELMLCQDRMALLREICAITEAHPGRVLNIRVGATDLCGLYGIRRRVDTPIYSVPMVAGCIADVVQVFGLGDRYTVSGPVWEYYSTPTPAHHLPCQDERNGLLQEVRLDVQNGLLGKTCVHPTQLFPIQASYVIPYEVYQDAVAVLGGNRDTIGVLASVRKNKMNELKPHALWAIKTLQQAAVFGVFHENTALDDLLQAAGAEE